MKKTLHLAALCQRSRSVALSTGLCRITPWLNTVCKQRVEGGASPNLCQHPVEAASAGASGSHCNRRSAACPWAWRIAWRLPTRASTGRGSWARMPGGSPIRIYLPQEEKRDLNPFCDPHKKTYSVLIKSPLRGAVCTWQHTESRTWPISDSDLVTHAVWAQWQQTL